MSEECMGSDRSEEMLNTVGPVGCVCVHTKMCVQMGAGNHSVGMRKSPVCVNLREDVFTLSKYCNDQQEQSKCQSKVSAQNHCAPVILV